jgi:hypothetical protein
MTIKPEKRRIYAYVETPAFYNLSLWTGTLKWSLRSFVMKKIFLSVILFGLAICFSFADSGKRLGSINGDIFPGQKAYAFDNPKSTAVSWIRVGTLSGNNFVTGAGIVITAIDGKPINANFGDIIAISAGKHTFEFYIKFGWLKTEVFTKEYIFSENGYFQLNVIGDYSGTIIRPDISLLTIIDIVILDFTETVRHGNEIGDNGLATFFVYGSFLEAEKKLGGTYLQRTIDGIRAKSKNDEDNLGVYDLTINPNQLVTLEIPYDLVVLEFDGKFVTWGEKRRTTWIRIPPGKHTLVFYYEWKSIKQDGGLISAIAGISRLTEARSTDNIQLTYDFFPGAFYEFKSAKDKTIKGGNVATVIAVPGKGAPKKQERGIGSSFAELNIAQTDQQTTINQSVVYSVSVNGTPAGPYTIAELKLLAQKRELTKDSLVWKEGMLQWAKADTVQELNSIFSAVPPPLPPQ